MGESELTRLEDFGKGDLKAESEHIEYARYALTATERT
jgi:hypothetical protein